MDTPAHATPTDYGASCSKDTTPAERRAFLLQLLVQDLPLGALVDAAAGRLPVVPLCTPLPQGGCDVPQHNRDGPCPKAGKTPRVPWKLYQTGAVPSATEVAKWRRRWPTANWAVAAGPGSGLLLLDEDGTDAAAYLPELVDTVRVQTGRDGGWHHYFAWPEGARIKNLVGFRPGWDVRAQGGLIILPGSLHPSGRHYTLDCASLAHGFAALPAGLLVTLETPLPVPTLNRASDTSCLAPARGRLDMVTVFDGVPEGQRDDTLWRLVFKLRQADVPPAITEAVVLQAAAACQPPFAADAVREKVQRAYSAPPVAETAPSTMACQAALDQARAEIAELRKENRELREELAELQRQESQAATRRLVHQLTRLDADPSTRSLGRTALVVLHNRAEAMAGGKPADTPIRWLGDERSRELGRSENTLRRDLDQLEEAGVIAREYRDLGRRDQGDWRRELYVKVVAELPDDLPDALERVYRQCREDRPPRPREKRGGACEACQTARCAEHPTAPIQKHIHIACTECGDAAAPDHVHQPQQPSTEGPPAILYLPNVRGPSPGGWPRLGESTPQAPSSDRKNCGSTYSETDRKNCGPTAPPSGDVLDQATAIVEQLTATLDTNALPPAQAVATRFKILDTVVRALHAGQPVPTAEELCDQCGAVLGPSELLRCDRCATVGVA